MPPCPKCNENIETLNEVSCREYIDVVKYDSTANDVVTIRYLSRHNETGDLVKHHFACPKCHKKIFNNRDKAALFLKQIPK